MDDAENLIELSRRAARDLRALQRRDRDYLVAELETKLSPVPVADNADVEPIVGHAPFMRLRIGRFRVLYRPLTPGELARMISERRRSPAPTGYLIERIVDRQYLERAVKTLDFGELA